MIGRLVVRNAVSRIVLHTSRNGTSLVSVQPCKTRGSSFRFEFELCLDLRPLLDDDLCKGSPSMVESIAEDAFALSLASFTVVDMADAAWEDNEYDEDTALGNCGRWSVVGIGASPFHTSISMQRHPRMRTYSMIKVSLSRCCRVLKLMTDSFR